MKQFILISIFFGLICPINILASVNSDMIVSIEQKESDKKNTDINSTSITLKTLQQLLNNSNNQKQKVITIRRINALKCLQKGIQPTTHGLSGAQAKIIREIFALHDSEESVRRQHLLKGQTELKNIQSFDDFKRVAMSIINDK